MKKRKESKENKANENDINIEISSIPIHGEPHDSFEMVNKYGTYNIQPTADTHHDYPTIAQGLSKVKDEESKKKKFGEK